MTQWEAARQNKVTPQIKTVADKEGLDTDVLIDLMRRGEAVIPYNKLHKPEQVCGVGTGLKTKVNANLGTSEVSSGLPVELEKLKMALKAKTDAVMDLSTGGNIDLIRLRILENSPVPVGSVPIYQVMVEAVRKGKALKDISVKDMLSGIEKHIKSGIDFITVHSGITKETVERIKNKPRLMNVVSRGGSFLVQWMVENGQENPLYKYFDEILDMAYEYDVTLSLGDGMRPGAIADATDSIQIQELIILGELIKRCREKGVQAIVEGPGHVPIQDVELNIKLQKRLTDNAPFYVLGPVVTDIAPGYDHITAAIGGAIAAGAGADFLCYVTKSEHLRLPTPEDVYEGVMITRIAAHVADIKKGIPEAIEWDNEMARAREALDWEKQFELSIDPELARKLYEQAKTDDLDVCSMCGEFCAVRGIRQRVKGKEINWKD